MPRERTPKKGKKGPLVLAVCIVILAVAAGLAVWLQNRSTSSHEVDASSSSSVVSSSVAVSEEPSSSLPAESAVAGAAQAAELPEEMRAMWISYLEWLKNDISDEEKMREVVGRMFSQCQEMGLNTVIVQVRPFSDAFYPSEIFPWSHHLTDEQGEDPGYDPLAVMIEEAHARGLRFEAWVNPYRINVEGENLGPEELAENHPAVLHPEWMREVEGVGVWYDPGIPEVQEMIVDGVREIVDNYAVDGVHIDDYFYPAFSAEQVEDGEDVTFDADTFAQHGNGMELAAWRRENVNGLVRRMYETVKEANPAVSFGISPQGNNENNYNQQYSDIKMWMATPGYADYMMPQFYWGFNYETQSGRTDAAFATISAEWASWPRDESVRLYAGLGAYRIEDGDGGAGDQSEWESGHNLADMVQHLRGVDGFTGFSLFRYENLYGKDASDLAEDEVEALTEVLASPEETGEEPESESEQASSTQEG